MLLRRYHEKAANAVEEAPVEEKPLKTVEEMTIAELKDYAAALNIELGDVTKKADILAVIKNAG